MRRFANYEKLKKGMEKSSERKVRVIIVSGKMMAKEAERFASKLKDLFKPYYLFSGKYQAGRTDYTYPVYTVCRKALHHEGCIEGHEMIVDERDVLSKIMVYNGRVKTYQLV